MPGESAADLLRRMRERAARVGVIGLGYVGLPLARAFAGKGFSCLGFDVDPAKVEALNAGRSYIRHIADADIAAMRATGRFEATGDFRRIAEADALLICVPTPLTRHREPDMSFIVGTGEAIAPHLRPTQLVVLESTTYPGTTTEVLRPILERSGLKAGEDIFLAFSPEREDPANPDFTTSTIPKVIGADDDMARSLASALYGAIVERLVPVSSTATAEAVKLTENIFRSVNIALVNELKLIFTRMGIDVWEVIEAAKTKPFGFMPFYPGPGLGGHCIPIDPFYLTWKAREFEVATRFIELAGQINTAMPAYVVDVLAEALGQRFERSLKGSRVLLLGMAYKKNVDDTRESPALKLIELIEKRGAVVDYHDPFVPVVPMTREHPEFAGRRSVPLTAEALSRYHAALICTDHDSVDYAELVRGCPLVVDTRNATRDVVHGRERIVKA
ncbi:MAG: nucleotide sugar dehydrogenase [Alphaproteobacteria bacterium]|nr:nucleotide sugar dehydrogenase [Alphaproteobacteria bacterium]